METETSNKEKIILKKYLISLVSLLILVILLLIKPGVNNTVTEGYFVISVIVICILTVVFPMFYFYKRESLFNFLFNVTDFFSLFIVACCLFQAIFVFGYFKADVSGTSMVPTLEQDDVLIVRSTSNVKNFDIVVIEYKEEYNPRPEYVDVKDRELLVKRLIGKPGDTLYVSDGVLYLNGKQYKEEYVKNKYSLYGRDFDLSEFVGKGVYKDLTTGNYIIQNGYCYCLGDNRDGSADSRMFGLFREEQIIGRLAYRVKSLFDWERIS